MAADKADPGPFATLMLAFITGFAHVEQPKQKEWARWKTASLLGLPGFLCHVVYVHYKHLNSTPPTPFCSAIPSTSSTYNQAML